MAERLTPQLRRRALSLPLTDRLALAESLRVSLLVPGTDNPDERLRYLADMMDAVSGVDIREDTHRHSVTWPRAVFVFIARREGFTQEAIGREIGRDHSTVCFLERKIRDIFTVPASYRDVIELYNKYTEML